MLHLLFPRLTARPKRGDTLFQWVTAKARAENWYRAGAVPDTVDGRFAMLATITAMVLVRCEALGEAGSEASVALSERFIDAMKAEHREMGLGDPTLGKVVQKLVGSLARRVEIWRRATGGGDWAEAVRDSVYGSDTPTPDSLAATVSGLRDTWSALDSAPSAAIAEGKIA
jgi:cytochrome b pre-mRNA-processing protein 3